MARLADLISQTAAKQAILRTISDICASFGPTFDITTQGQIVLGKISKILRFTSGSILLPKGGALVTIAWIYPPEIRDPMVFDLSRPAGIAPSVFKTGKLVRFGSREEIDKCPPAFEGSREKRDLRSLLVVPLKAGKEVIGVIEVGAPEEHVYSGDDESLLETLAHYLAMRWKSNQDYAALTSVVRQSNRADLLKAIVERIPPLVHGTGCSIFLRDTSKWKPTVDGPTWNENRGPSPFDSLPARLVDSHGEFQKKVELAYEPMQGLTGWVLATGKPMRIDRGRGARTKFPLTLSPSAKWVGLPADGQMLHPKHYYEDHPFLAVPIKGSDGSVFGVIRIPDSLEDHFTDFDQNALEACASVLATVIEATNALEAVRAVNAELTHLRAAIEGVDRYLKDLAPKARREFSSRSAALIGTLSFIFGGSLLLLPGTTWHAAILPIAAAAVAWSYAWWRRPV